MELGAKVIAIELQQKCHEFLSKRFGDSIEFFTQGLREKEDISTMYISESTLISSFSKNHVDMMQEDRFNACIVYNLFNY